MRRWLRNAYSVPRPIHQQHSSVRHQHTAATAASANPLYTFSSRHRHVLVFPGQGSQRVGAGADIVRTFPYASHTYDEADEALHMPLSQLIWTGQQSGLRPTWIAQPAILTHSVAVWRVVCRELGYESAADVCSAVMGHSLGEFTALCVSGVLSFTDAVRLVYHRGLHMSECAPPNSTAMAALLGCSLPFAQQLCVRAAAHTGGVCVIANINTASQIVIAGQVEAVERAVELGKSGNGEERVKRAVRLDVSAPFHSPIMQPARDRMAAEIAALSMKRPCVPIISNVTAETVSDVEELRALMLEHFTSPVQWYRSVLYCLGQGMDEYTELGPSSVVAGLIADVHRHTQSTQSPLQAPATNTTHALCTAEDLQRFIAQQQSIQKSESGSDG